MTDTIALALVRVSAYCSAMNIAAKIAALAPARSVVLSQSNGYTVRAERSGDGKTLRIVREHRDGFEVISARPFGTR